MAEGMRRLAADPALRQQLGTAASARAERDYSLRAFRRNVDRIYDDLARRGQPVSKSDTGA